MTLAPGAIFAGFTVERKLGAGGMGVVYLAHHPRLPRQVALKLLRGDLVADASFVARFRREAETVARLNHPNIVQVDDVGVEDGQLWLSMPFIDGTTAERAVSEYEKGMPAARAVHIVSKVGAALDFAHRNRLIHRDVKPANILLAAGEEDEPELVYLSDFGVVKAMGELESQRTALTNAGDVIATLDYAAPEQIEGRALDARSDIYALGCVLYKLLTGAVPYRGDSIAAKVYAHLHLPPPAVSDVVPLPPAIDAVIARAMARDREDRFPTCRALAAAARDAVAGAATHPDRPAPPPLPAARPAGPERDGPPADPTTVVGAAHAAPSLAGRSEPVGPGEGAKSASRRTEDQETVRVGPAAPSETRAERPLAGQGGGAAGSGNLAAGQGSAAAALGGAGAGGGTWPPHGTEPSRAGQAGARQAGVDPMPGETVRGRGRRRVVLVATAALLVAVITAVTVLIIDRGAARTGATGQTPSTSTSPAASASTAGSKPPATGTAAGTRAGSATSTGQSAISPALPRAEQPLAASQLIVGRKVPGGFNLDRLDADSGRSTTLFATPRPAGANPLISQDRRTVVYVQGSEGLRTIGTDGLGDRAVGTGLPAGCTSVGRPAWNPVHQGRFVVKCVRDNSFVVDVVDTSGRVLGTVDTGLATVDDLSFSPDGAYLSYWGAQEPAAGSGSLYLQRIDGGRPVQVTAGSSDVDPVWSPVASRIAFSRSGTVEGDAVNQIMQLDVGPLIESANPPAGSAKPVPTQPIPTPVTGPEFNPFVNQGPSWSPDGTRVAFKSTRPETGTIRAAPQIWVISVDGRQPPRRLAGPGAVIGSPAWSNR